MIASRSVPIAYITKYALTQGIIILRNCECVEGKYLSKMKGSSMGWFVGPGGWYETEAEAQAKAQLMIQKKIASMKKKMDKLLANLGQKVKMVTG